jgi:hypothetical protein
MRPGFEMALAILRDALRAPQDEVKATNTMKGDP